MGQHSEHPPLPLPSPLDGRRETVLAIARRSLAGSAGDGAGPPDSPSPPGGGEGREGGVLRSRGRSCTPTHAPAPPSLPRLFFLFPSTAGAHSVRLPTRVPRGARSRAPGLSARPSSWQTPCLLPRGAVARSGPAARPSSWQTPCLLPRGAPAWDGSCLDGGERAGYRRYGPLACLAAGAVSRAVHGGGWHGAQIEWSAFHP